VEERDAQALLERADLPADRRLAQIERLAGMREAAGIGNGVKHPELVPVHASLSFAARCARRCRPSLRRCYSAALSAAAASSAARNFSASSAAMQPMPAAVTAWRNTLSFTSPAAKTPGTSVAVESGLVTMYPASSILSLPLKILVAGS